MLSILNKPLRYIGTITVKSVNIATFDENNFIENDI